MVSLLNFQHLDPHDETRCVMCPYGTLPDADHMDCIALPEVYLTLQSPLAIGAVAFAVVGIIVTVMVLAVYIRHNDTPIIRASGRELSYVLLVGLLLCYSVTFILIIKPTNFVCAAQQFLIGLCFRLSLASVEFKLPYQPPSAAALMQISTET